MASEEQEYYADQGENGQAFQQEAAYTGGGEEDTSGYAGGDQQLEETNAGGGAHEEDDDDRKIFVGGLSWETSEPELKNYFSKYGEITKCTLKTEAVTGKSRGFGFVVFQDLPSVEKVLEAGTHKLHGRNIDPKRANPKKREPNLKVFVGGLSTDTPESDIRDHFQKYGKITEIDLPVDQEKKRRGFCFIKFDTEDTVRRVTESRMQQIGGKEVEVKKSVPKRGGFQQGGGWGGGFAGGRGGGGRGGRGGGRGGYGGGWNQGGYQQQGYGGYGGQGYQGYQGYNQGGYGGGYGGYDYNQGYGGYNQGYGGAGNWGGYDQGYGAGGYDYSGWSGYGQDQGQNSGGYGKTPKRGGGHGYQPY